MRRDQHRVKEITVAAVKRKEKERKEEEKKEKREQRGGNRIKFQGGETMQEEAFRTSRSKTVGHMSAVPDIA
eukprot:2790934-Rhodomonas_salina.1